MFSSVTKIKRTHQSHQGVNRQRAGLIASDFLYLYESEFIGKSQCITNAGLADGIMQRMLFQVLLPYFGAQITFVICQSSPG